MANDRVGNRLRPYWTSGTQSFSGSERLTDDLHFDVAVIGAGITGLSTALCLAEAGRSVAVFDAGEIGAGDTSRTTAHLTEEVDGRYHHIASAFGKDGAGKVARSSRAAIEQIATWVQRYQIDCEFTRLPGYFYSEKASDSSFLLRELKASRRAGLPTSWKKRAPLPFPVAGAIEYPDQAIFQPVSYLHGLARAIAKHGGRFFLNHFIDDIQEGSPCELRAGARRVRADQVVVATHSPVSTRFQIHTKIAAYRSYAIAVRVESPKRLPGFGLFWDTADPYHYLRPESASHPDVWIIGGEDHKTGHEPEKEDPFDRLRSYARDRFGPIHILAEWSGQVHEPVDGIPYIGLPTGSKHVWIATGFAGNGMTYGTLSGRIISDGILGLPNEWANLYRATRVKPLTAARDFITENLDFPKCMIMDRLKPAEAHSIEEVGRGEGKLLRLEGSDQRIACYRDGSGQIHQLSAVCPHMGCLVRFNSSEKTWDCPCHGSRFSIEGNVLNGPARSGLEPITEPLKPGKPAKKDEAA